MGPSRSILSVQAVVDRLPQAFDGVAGVVTIIDDNFLSGTDADEVLEALGVTRADAIVVVVEYDAVVATAIVVPGIQPTRVLAEVADTWRATVDMRRKELQIAGQPTLVLVGIDEAYAITDSHGIVFIAGGTTEQSAIGLLNRLLADPTGVGSDQADPRAT